MQREIIIRKMKPKHIALLILTVLTACNEPQNVEHSTPKVVKVKTLTVHKTSLENSRTYSATIEETGGTALSFASAGTIGKIYVSVGQTVTKGQLIAEIDPISAQNAYEAAKASKEQALDAEKRMKQLYDAGSLSEIKWIEVQTQVKQAVSMEQIAHKSLTDTKLYSPTSGYVADKMAEAGQNAAPGVPIVKIVHIDKVKTSFSVPEGEISDIKNGQQVEITVAALDNKIFNASITEKGITADPLSRSYTVKAEIANPNRELLPGMICSAALIDANQSAASKAVTVDANIVQIDSDNKPFVWTVNNETAQKAYISIAGNFGDKVIVGSGLNDGDKIIAQGAQKVSNGMKVIEN